MINQNGYELLYLITYTLTSFQIRKHKLQKLFSFLEVLVKKFILNHTWFSKLGSYMPKKGIFLPPQAINAIKTYLDEHNLTREEFAENMGVASRTVTNWLSGKTSVDNEKLELIIKILGIGVQELLGNVPEEYNVRSDFPSIFRVVLNNTQLVTKLIRIYKNAVMLFFKYVTLNKYPETGFFDTFYHDENKGKNYYSEIWILSNEPIDKAKFVISFTLAERIRVDYGEIQVEKDRVTAYQYYQDFPDVSQRPTEHNCIAKFTTWFGEESCLFIVRSNIKFRVEVKGKIPDHEICQANDIAAFWKTIMCNRYRGK